MSVILKSGSSSDLATVNSNKELTVSPTKTKANAGYIALVTDNNPNGVISDMVAPETSQNNRLKVGMDTVLFSENFNYLAQNTANWLHTFTTMTATVSGGALLLNANNTNTTATGVNEFSKKFFPIIGKAGLMAEFIVANINPFLANEEVTIGFFPAVAVTVAPTDGVYLRLTSAGIILVLNYNGVETESAPSNTLNSAIYTKLAIKFNRRSISAWQDEVKIAEVIVPNGNNAPCLSSSLPVGLMYRNTGTVTGTAMQFKVSNVTVLLTDVNAQMQLQDQQAFQGQLAAQGQNGGTMGSTALYSNSLAAGAGAVMTNTTAALGAGLGGQFSALPTLAAGTDGILCSYLNPAGTVNVPGRTLMITGVRIQGVVSTVLAGNATPVIYAYALCFGHTALSLATAESASFATATTKAPRRIPIGIESYAAAAAVGTVGSSDGVKMSFRTPISVAPGEYTAISAKNIGVVTTTGVITVLVTFDGYYI